MTMDGRLHEFCARNRVPAAGMAVVNMDGEIAVDVAGVTQRDGGESVVSGDAWHIGSCAKSLTAALYGRLVDEGQAAWAVPIAELFPDLRGTIHPGWGTPTVDELLTCRSGLRANLTRAEARASYADPRSPAQQRTDAVVAALGEPPGAHGRFRYSNLGYVVVGAAIDRLAGDAFESALARRLLEPLGATSAGFGPPPRIWGHRPRVQLGGLCIGRGHGADPSEPRSDNAPVLTPAGRLHLSLGDWARLQRVFLDGTGLLAPASLAHVLRVPVDGRGMAMGWAPSRRLTGTRLGMQGSNTCWAASALMRDDGRVIAMAIVNDGRTSMLRATSLLALELVDDSRRMR